jgi:hypothetical protein
VLLVAAFLSVAGTEGHADAAEGQWQAGGRGGVAWLSSARWGPSANLFLRHGLADSLDLDVDISASLHPFQPDANLAAGGGSELSTPWVIVFSPGLVYRWDVLQWVPFVGAGLGVYASDGVADRDNGGQLGASGRAGVEYLVSRDVVLSVQASTFIVLSESPLPVPWVQLTAGAGYSWGW